MKILSLLLLFCCLPVLAYETDQFTVPPLPLADVGEDFTKFVKTEIDIVIDQVNNRDEIKETISKLERLQTYENPHETQEDITKRLRLTKEIAETKRLLELTGTEEGIITLVADRIGGALFWQDQRDGVFGIGLSIFPYKKNMKNGVPILYIPGRLETIYSFSGFHRLISASYFVFCSTMQAYGIYFGVDKLGHMFNQRFQYYELFQKAKAAGESDEAALKKAVDFGVDLEFKLFGKLVDGVYSNGDLAANIAGLFFYKNLFETIKLENKEHRPLLKLDKGKLSYRLNIETDLNFMAKFFTDHLNEALNPSHIEKLQQKSVTKAIVKRCEKIRTFYQLHSQTEATQKLQSMKRFYDLPYGHNEENLLKIDQLCY